MKQELQDMLADCTAELTDIEAKINALPALDKSRQYFSNYALIKACGTVEFVYRSIVADHFSQLGDTKIDKYLDTTIRQGSNSAKYENMCGILGKFDVQWQSTFKSAVQAEPNSQRLILASNSLVKNRHLFAHGKPPTATFLDIKSYYLDVITLINIFDSIVR